MCTSNLKPLVVSLNGLYNRFETHRGEALLAARAVPSVTTITVNRDFEGFEGRPSAAAAAGTNGPTSAEDDYPDVELVLGASSLAGDIIGAYRGLLGLTEEFYEEVYGGYVGANAFTIVPVLLRPKSRGRLTLRSRDPTHQPILDINYYDHEDDLNTMVLGIKKVGYPARRGRRRDEFKIFNIKYF